jgi:hypothetical protein
MLAVIAIRLYDHAHPLLQNKQEFLDAIVVIGPVMDFFFSFAK